MLVQQIKRLVINLKVSTEDQKLYQQIKSWINRSKARSTDQKLD